MELLDMRGYIPCARHICPCGIGPLTHVHNQEDAMTTTPTLTEKEKAALLAVKDGGDVWDRSTAVTLRALEKRGLVSIVKAMEPLSGEKAQPFFGAITTKAGLAAIRETRG
jgi:hypothetical protein